MNTLNLSQIKVRGDLAHRQLLNYKRLESDIYRPESVFSSGMGEWPGDWLGRTILGLTKLKETTHREPAYSYSILSQLPEHLNEAGYLGPVIATGEYNEQQLAGHNWLIRGLMEYSRLSGETQYLEMARRIIHNLYLPLKGAFLKYPTDKSRIGYGAPDGKLTGANVSGWLTSTDVGCAFICLDGLAQAYNEFGMTELKDLLEEMIEKFKSIDLIGSSLQTHATLTATRGIMAFYRATGQKCYLALAEKIFKLYKSYGMTVNYANFNWFGRPLWTEPCAIVDSYMLTRDLFIETQKPEYLEMCHKIYFNALCHAQRSNGGFGCDLCVHEGNHYLSIYGKSLDAYWCCSMRGAEGLAAVSSSIAFIDESRIYITFYLDSEIRIEGAKITITTRYPEEGSVHIKIEGKPVQKEIALFIPDYAVNSFTASVDGLPVETVANEEFAVIKLQTGSCAIDLNFSIPLCELPYPGKQSCHFYQYGYVVLGADTKAELTVDRSDLSMIAPATYQDRRSGVVLKPLNDTYKRTPEETFKMQRQLLFTHI